MLGWFQALMPKEGRFFALFEKHAAIVVAGAEALRGLLQGGDSVEAYCQQICSIGSNAGQLNALTTKIITLEEEADDICNRGLKALYLTNRQDGNPGNAMKFVIGSELYEHLEKVVDRFEDVANEINSIVVDQL